MPQIKNAQITKFLVIRKYYSMARPEHPRGTRSLMWVINKISPDNRPCKTNSKTGGSGQLLKWQEVIDLCQIARVPPVDRRLGSNSFGHNSVYVFISGPKQNVLLMMCNAGGNCRVLCCVLSVDWSVAFANGPLVQ